MKMLRDSVAEKAADAAIAAECAKFGVYVNSPWDLVGKNAWKAKDPKLLEALSQHLDRGYPPMTMEGLISVLGKPEAKPFVFEKLVAILMRERNSYIGQDAANAILHMLEPKDASLVQAVMDNADLGGIRSFFVSAYSKLFKKTAIPTLRRLIKDSNMGNIVEAAKALAVLDDQESREMLMQLTTHPDSYVRQPVRRALKRLDAKLERLSSRSSKH